MSNDLNAFPTYGWIPDSDLSDDNNYMDLVLILTRSSQLKQGSMACILVRPRDEQESSSTTLTDRIISVATNQSLFKENESDIHAEIVAISKVARSNGANSTNTAYAYITMPPCKRCFAALLESGIRRIVSRYPSPEAITAVARARGIEMVIVPENRHRINDIIQRHNEIHSRVEDRK